MPEGENVQKMFCFWVFVLPAKGEGIAWQLDNVFGSTFYHLVLEEMLHVLSVNKMAVCFLIVSPHYQIHHQAKYIISNPYFRCQALSVKICLQDSTVTEGKDIVRLMFMCANCLPTEFQRKPLSSSCTDSTMERMGCSFCLH